MTAPITEGRTVRDHDDSQTLLWVLLAAGYGLPVAVYCLSQWLVFGRITASAEVVPVFGRLLGGSYLTIALAAGAVLNGWAAAMARRTCPVVRPVAVFGGGGALASAALILWALFGYCCGDGPWFG